MSRISSFPILLCVLFFFSCSSNFDKDVWNDSIDERKEMIDDLVNNILPNLNRHDISSLLGIPNDEYFQNADLVYLLGDEQSYMSIDSDWLLIYLNDNDMFIYYEIKTD